MQSQPHSWNNRSYFPYQKYPITSPNEVVIIGARKARKARLTKSVSVATAAVTTTTRTIPAANYATMKLLESWLSAPTVEPDEFQERLEQLIEENRL